MDFSRFKDIDRDADTVRPRTFRIELSDGDIVYFSRIAKEHGTTPAEILQGFICDLIDGTYANGSDERYYAQRYFDRCLYGLENKQTFLTWLLKDGSLDSVSELLEIANDSALELEYYKLHPEDPDGVPDFIEALKKEQAYANEEIASFYSDYVADQKRLNKTAQDMQEGIEETRAYLQELKTMLAES